VTRAVLRDLQRHPGKPFVLHMDLQRVQAAEKIKMNVPLHFIGEETSVGVKAGGMVSHDLTEVQVECLPKDLPEYIEVDISGLDVGESLHLTDLGLPGGVLLTELARGEGHDLGVVSIHTKRVVEEAAEAEGAAEAAPEAAAEGGDKGKESGEGE
jgi:large subunit ribosomal protein L25